MHEIYDVPAPDCHFDECVELKTKVSSLEIFEERYKERIAELQTENERLKDGMKELAEEWRTENRNWCDDSTLDGDDCANELDGLLKELNT